MFLSIIVPVYNVEPYLKKCIDSILKCDLTDSEIIFVTGTSADNSSDICEVYGRAYSFIKIIEQDDIGLSDARNCGLRIAKGDYIAFIDSDDYIIPEKFQLLLDIIMGGNYNHIEVFVSDFDRVLDNGFVIDSIRQIDASKTPMTDYSVLREFLTRKGCFWNVWRFVYKRDFLIRNQIWFLQRSLSEDIDYTVRVILLARVLAFFHNPYYCYCVGRGNSLMDIATYKRVKDTVSIITSSVQLIKKNDTFIYQVPMIRKLLFELILNISTIFEVPISDRDKTKEVFLDAVKLLDCEHCSFAQFAYRVISVLGISFTGYILLLLKKIKRLIKRRKKCECNC